MWIDLGWKFKLFGEFNFKRLIYDSFPIGVAADLCPTGIPWLWFSKMSNQQNL